MKFFFEGLIMTMTSFCTQTCSLPDSKQQSLGRYNCALKPLPKERIINNVKIIEEATKGVAVDYSYNETICSSETGSISSPGCPKSIDGIPWLHHGNPPRCYFPGFKGPCDTGDVLDLPPRNSPMPHVGLCVCDWAIDEELLGKLEKSHDKKYGYKKEEIGRIYSFEKRKCYLLEEQGPCATGKVLIRLLNSTTLTCVRAFHRACRYAYHDLDVLTCEKTTPQVFTVASIEHDIRPTDCHRDEVYSKTLDRCTKKRFHGSFMG